MTDENVVISSPHFHMVSKDGADGGEEGKER
jgi:hypothetical protein